MSLFTSPYRVKCGEYMHVFNPFWCYAIGLHVHQLKAVTPGWEDMDKLAALSNARGILQQFSPGSDGDEIINDVFPKSREAAGAVVGVIDGIWLNPSSPRRLITPDNVNNLVTAVSEFERAFKEECESAANVFLTEQRELSVITLVSKPSKLVSRDAWAAIPEMAKAEISRAAYALAFESYTGSGFHFVRAVEVVMREFVTLSTGSLPHKRDWGYYLDTLKGKADTTLLSQLDNLRQSDRNPLMHPEVVLDMDGALDVKNVCTTCINRMISDMRSKNLLPTKAVKA